MMNNTLVNFYRGCHGMGVVISVAHNKDRVIFDFGAPFSPLAEIYDGTVLVRNENRVKDALILGRIPQIPGVFAKKDLKDFDLLSYEESDLNTAILICHLHLDHMSEINKVHPDIPVYIEQSGLKLNSIIDEMEDNRIYRSYNSFKYNVPFNIGQIKITPYFSDHPCAGSSSFLIETPDSRILYSGDIRYHGLNSEKAFKVMESFNNIDLFIVDSTTTSPSEFSGNCDVDYNIPSKELLPNCIKEQDLYDDTYKSMLDFNGIGVFNMYPRDLNMLKNMYELGIKLNRETIYEPYYANILYNLSGITPTVIEPVNSIKMPYIEKLKGLCKFISINDIRNNPEKYLLQNSYRNILNLIDLDKIPGKYFHLLGEPLVKECKEYQIMLNFIKKLNWEFKSYINLYSFSHAYPNQLAYIIEKVNAKTVVAVHSKHPENLNPGHSKQVFPQEGIDYLLKNGELIKL